MPTKTEQMLPKSGVSRGSFSTYYKYGEKEIYVVGGMKVTNFELLRDFMIFDTQQLTWKTMPKMIEPRNRPGCFKNKEFLYIFCGKNNSVERFIFEENIW